MAVYPERRNGHLSGKWIAEVTKTGERRRKRFDTKYEAERWADFTKVTGAPPATAVAAKAAHAFGDVVKEALEHHPGWAGNRDPSRQQRLTYAIDTFGAETDVSGITRADLDGLIQSLKRRKVTPGTVNRYLGLVSAVLRFGRSRGYAASTPDIPWQKEAGRRIHWLTEAQERALGRVMLKEGRVDEELTLRVLTSTGMRWSEFATLAPRQVTDTWVKLDKTKTNTPRDVPIAPKLAVELRAMLVRGAVPAYYTFRDTLKRALKNAGQNTALSIHCLRHTTATRLILAGVPLPIVQKFLGHSSINTTIKYTHVTEQSLQDALAKLSPHAGQTANEPENDSQEAPVNAEKVEATAGIEPTYTVLQTDL